MRTGQEWVKMGSHAPAVYDLIKLIGSLKEIEQIYLQFFIIKTKTSSP
jgi:hypothetical protein